MIRPITPDDTVDLINLAKSIGFFSPDELKELRQMLTDSLSQSGNTHPFWITDEDDGLVGLAYYEPERMTSGTWNLQLIAGSSNSSKGRAWWEAATFCRGDFGESGCAGLVS